MTINRFTSPRRLIGYLGLDPRVRQSGKGAGHTGRISKEGAAAVHAQAAYQRMIADWQRQPRTPAKA